MPSSHQDKISQPWVRASRASKPPSSPSTARCTASMEENRNGSSSTCNSGTCVARLRTGIKKRSGREPGASVTEAASTVRSRLFSMAFCRSCRAAVWAKWSSPGGATIANCRVSDPETETAVAGATAAMKQKIPMKTIGRMSEASVRPLLGDRVPSECWQLRPAPGCRLQRAHPCGCN